MKSITNEDKVDKRAALAVIVCFSIVRCAIAFSMELGTDEAYYWLYSQNIKWNYFDHPPVVALWIRLFTANLLLQETEGFIRLGSVVGCAISSWAIYQTCTLIHSTKAGLLSVCLYNASFFAAVTAGIFIMPDGPQMVFYTIALWMIARITKDENSLLAWVAFGVAAGLCIMSKIYGFTLWTGLGLFAVFKKRAWFNHPGIYLSLAITALIASPILLWNFNNDFLTYKFHADRADVSRGGFDITTFGREVTNQVLYNNPFNVIAIVAALLAFAKSERVHHTSAVALSIFNFIALPLAVMLLVISLFRDTTLPHWSGPAYVAMIPLAAIYLAGKSIRYAGRLVIGSMASFAVFLVIWQYLIHYAPESIGVRDADKKDDSKARQLISRLLSGFKSFQLIAETKNSWKPADDAFLKLYQQETNSGKMEKNTPLICYKWWGAHVEYYFCYPNNIPMIGLGEPDDLHEYLFTNAARKNKVALNTAYCIVPADDAYNVRARYSSYYHKIDNSSVISVKRKGKPDVTFYVYKLRGWKNRWPVVQTEKPIAGVITSHQ